MFEPLRILLLVSVFCILLHGVVTYSGLVVWGLLICCPPRIFSAMEMKILCVLGDTIKKMECCFYLVKFFLGVHHRTLASHPSALWFMACYKD